MKKIQPSELTINLKLPEQTGAGDTYRYVDLSQIASILSRRFYRQGLNWAVKGFTFHNVTGAQGSIQISKLPTTWIMSNAWEKTFRVWRQMIDNATDDSEMESIKGRFLDFKIFADLKHHELGVGANLLPFVKDLPGLGLDVDATPGQWQMSDITIPSTTGSPGNITDYELIAVGPNNPGAGASGKDAKSVIQGYADSRALPAQEDPNVPVDASLNWMGSLFNDGNLQTNAVIGMLEVTGDNPPYPFEGDAAGTVDTMYPGGETQLRAMVLHDQMNATTTTVSNKTHSRGGQFPCGLIRIQYDSTLEDGILQIHLVPGHHRGYLAEPMQEM